MEVLEVEELDGALEQLDVLELDEAGEEQLV